MWFGQRVHVSVGYQTGTLYLMNIHARIHAEVDRFCYRTGISVKAEAVSELEPIVIPSC